MMTGTFSPWSVSLGRRMSTATRSGLPSLSLSVPATSTNTVWLMASAREKIGWVALFSTLIAGVAGVAAAGAVPARLATNSAVNGTMSLDKALRGCMRGSDMRFPPSVGISDTMGVRGKG